MLKGFTVTEFFKRFPNDDACLDHLMAVRYGETLDCPKCGKHGRFARIKKMPAFSCAWCGHHIHPMAGTPFQSTRTPLQKWFYAMYFFTTTRHGVPAKELQRQLGVTYKTAWRMGHEIRKYMADVDGDGGLSGHVEIDEMYLGGVRSGKRGRGAEGKSIVFGMVQRGGSAITRVVDNLRKGTVRGHIAEHVAKGTTISTDEYFIYKTLSKMGYQHGVVRHSFEEWANGDTHTNTIENLWGILKRSIKGTHISVSKKHLPKYLGEFEFRFNLRHDPEEMFHRLLMEF